jgi:hypothetical protein
MKCTLYGVFSLHFKYIAIGCLHGTDNTHREKKVHVQFNLAGYQEFVANMCKVQTGTHWGNIRNWYCLLNVCQSCVNFFNQLQLCYNHCREKKLLNVPLNILILVEKVGIELLKRVEPSSVVLLLTPIGSTQLGRAMKKEK